jgi:flagellar motor switch protein FliN/FliY
MTPEEALLGLGETTTRAVGGALKAFAGDAVAHDAAALLSDLSSSLETVAVPRVVASAAQLEGRGALAVFAVTALGARRLAALMTGEEGAEAGELSELELSAVGEAMTQVLTAAAAAAGSMLGETIEVGVPTTRLVTTAEGGEDPGPGVRGTATPFTLCGEPALFAQVAPEAWIERLVSAVGGMGEVDPRDLVSVAAMLDVPVQVAVELGRARMGLGHLVGLFPGSVIELDAGADDPVEIFVNGTRFALGRLLVDAEGAWAFRVESLLGVSGSGLGLVPDAPM